MSESRWIAAPIQFHFDGTKFYELLYSEISLHLYFDINDFTIFDCEDYEINFKKDVASGI